MIRKIQNIPDILPNICSIMTFSFLFKTKNLYIYGLFPSAFNFNTDLRNIGQDTRFHNTDTHFGRTKII